jgi:hypothetical protein
MKMTCWELKRNIQYVPNINRVGEALAKVVDFDFIVVVVAVGVG